jgi:hypothetical protein
MKAAYGGSDQPPSVVVHMTRMQPPRSDSSMATLRQSFCTSATCFDLMQVRPSPHSPLVVWPRSVSVVVGDGQYDDLDGAGWRALNDAPPPPDQSKGPSGRLPEIREHSQPIRSHHHAWFPSARRARSGSAVAVSVTRLVRDLLHVLRAGSLASSVVPIATRRACAAPPTNPVTRLSLRSLHGAPACRASDSQTRRPRSRSQHRVVPWSDVTGAW